MTEQEAIAEIALSIQASSICMSIVFAMLLIITLVCTIKAFKVAKAERNEPGIYVIAGMVLMVSFLALGLAINTTVEDYFKANVKAVPIYKVLQAQGK